MRRSVLAILLLTLQGYHAQPNTTTPSAVVSAAPTTTTPPPTETPVETPIPTTTPAPSTSSPTPPPTTAPPSSPPPQTTTPPPATNEPSTTTTVPPDPTTTTPPPPSTTVTTPSPSSDSSTMTPTPRPPSTPGTIASPDVTIIDPNIDDAVIPEVTSDQLRATTPSDVSTASSESGGPNTVGWVMIVAGILVGIGLLLGAVWFVRRRQQDNEDDEDFYDSFFEKGAQSHPSMTVEDSRHAANFPGDFGASTAQVEKDSMFFTWRSPSPKIQAPIVTSLMPPCEDDAAAMMVMRTPSNELVLHNDVPNNFHTGEQSSSIVSYQYTQRGNQDTERPPVPNVGSCTTFPNRSPVKCHHNDWCADDDDDAQSFTSVASSDQSAYSPRSSSDSTNSTSNFEV